MMKTDRELLELAAKAAEVTGGWGDKIEYHNGAVDLRDVWILEGDDFVPWSPLTDDGDALRLAVKLGIAPIQHIDERLCAAYWTDVRCRHCSYGDDPYAATRRAIVRAAAAIGESTS